MRSPDTGVIFEIEPVVPPPEIPCRARFRRNALRRRGDPFGGYAGRRRERPRHDLARESDLENLPVSFGLHEVHDQRRCRANRGACETRAGRGYRYPVLLLASRLRSPSRSTRPPATPADLAALHRQLDLGTAGKARDGTELGSENGVHDLRHLLVIAAAAGRADDKLLVWKTCSKLRDAALRAARRKRETSSLVLPSQFNFRGVDHGRG